MWVAGSCSGRELLPSCPVYWWIWLITFSEVICSREGMSAPGYLPSSLSMTGAVYSSSIPTWLGLLFQIPSWSHLFLFLSRAHLSAVPPVPPKSCIWNTCLLSTFQCLLRCPLKHFLLLLMTRQAPNTNWSVLPAGDMEKSSQRYKPAILFQNWEPFTPLLQRGGSGKQKSQIQSIPSGTIIQCQAFLQFPF